MLDWSWIQSVPDWAKFVAVGLIGVFVGKFLPSYLTEKGKNLATKEDIGEITKIVEATKNDLGMLREEITSVRKQGRDAVVSFLEKSNVFSHEFSESVRLVRENKVQEFLDNHLHPLEKHIADLGLAQTRIFVYFHEKKNIVKAANAVMLSAREASTVLKRKAVESLSMRQTFKNIDTLIPENQRTTITPETLRSAMANNVIKKEKELDAEIEASHKKFSLAVDEFTGKTSSFFEQICLKSENRS